MWCIHLFLRAQVSSCGSQRMGPSWLAKLGIVSLGYMSAASVREGGVEARLCQEIHIWHLSVLKGFADDN